MINITSTLSNRMQDNFLEPGMIVEIKISGRFVDYGRLLELDIPNRLGVVFTFGEQQNITFSIDSLERRSFNKKKMKYVLETLTESIKCLKH